MTDTSKYELPEEYYFVLEMQGEVAEIRVHAPRVRGILSGEVLGVRRVKKVDDLDSALSELAGEAARRENQLHRTRVLSSAITQWTAQHNVTLQKVDSGLT